MERNKHYELFLNHLTLWEELESSDTFEEYKKHVILLLQCKNLYVFEDDILKRIKAKDIEQVLMMYPHILYTGTRRKNKAGETVKAYYDLAAEYDVTPQDVFYDIFFVYKLKQVDILQTDLFLEYHLARYYNGNIEEFSRFLQLCLRKHQGRLLSPLIAQTVNEWITAKEKQAKAELSGSEERTGKKKGSRLKREAHDKLTSLSQEQTVLLMYYLQQERVILRDEFLSDLDAGRAFEILTGFSQHTLRQAFSKYSLYLTKENLKEIDHLLTRMKIAIDKDLKRK